MLELKSNFCFRSSLARGSLLRIPEEKHLKEMGVAKVGHRLQFCERLRELRKAAKMTVGGLDMDSLLSQ